MILVCGIDEVGRGSLAGPLISVATLFQGHETGCRDVDDSKKLSANKREKVFRDILHSPKLVDFGIGQVSVEEINEMGIDRANAVSFVRAVEGLCRIPNFIIVDGVNGLEWSSPYTAIKNEPKADGTYPVVGAASILAKVIRDRYMCELSEEFPVYCWESNKGYGSKDHCDALQSCGATRHHRKKFVSKYVTAVGGWT